MTTDVPARDQSRTSLAQRVPTVLLIAGVGALAFLGGVLFATRLDSPHNDDDFQIFWNSWDILEQDYYYSLPGKAELTQGAIQGLLSTTEDPYTFWVPPADAEIDRQRTAGEFGGIGAYVGETQDGQLIITAPFEGLPAEAAGLLAGDIIEEVDGVSLVGWNFEDAVALLRGDIGSKLTLGIFRSETSEHFEATLTRARVELPTVESRMIDDVGYVRLYSFNSLARANLEESIATLLADDPRALIVDLRNNPGGLLDQAVEVSDLFLDEGVVVTQRSRNSDEIGYSSADGDIAEAVPLVVLVDGGSASASEVVAGALHDRGRALLVGQTTYGKGSVQYVYDLADGSQLHVTTALWFTPNEAPIQGQGLEPDVIVPDDAEFDGEMDPFLVAAIQALDDGLAPDVND